MSHYKKVLVATDFSQGYLPLIKKAEAEAKEHHASLHIISVVPDVTLYMPEALASLESIESEFAALMKERMKKAKSQVSPEAHFVMKKGTPKHEIIQYAREIKADLLVIGSHKSQDHHINVGSTIHAVLHRAECDVLVVRISENY